MRPATKWSEPQNLHPVCSQNFESFLKFIFLSVYNVRNILRETGREIFKQPVKLQSICHACWTCQHNSLFLFFYFFLTVFFPPNFTFCHYSECQNNCLLWVCWQIQAHGLLQSVKTVFFPSAVMCNVSFCFSQTIRTLTEVLENL